MSPTESSPSSAADLFKFFVLMVRLVTFGYPFLRGTSVGVLVGLPTTLTRRPRILDLGSINKEMKTFSNPDIFTDMVTFIEEAGDDGVEWVKDIVAKYKEKKLDFVPIGKDQDFELLSPIHNPRRNIFCVGKNYKDHVDEVAAADKARGIGTTSAAAPTADQAEKPKHYPQFFTKATTAVTSPFPNGHIESHGELTKWLDYEAELAVVIGKKGRDLTLQNAMDHVFGYMIANDVTARDIQRRHGQWFKGKSLDNTCPMGPYLVHKSAIRKVYNLPIKLWVGDELRQDGNTSNMICSIPELLVHLSQGMTLNPGDILLTGTPQGVGYAMNPPKVLKPGDKVSIEIKGLGRLENFVK